MRRILSVVGAAVLAVGVVAPASGAAPRWATWASTNWSGYVVQRSGVHSVAGTWIVPMVARTTRPSFSATWIGIGGFTERQLVQVGTEQDSADGVTTYSAWWEILPYPQQLIGMTVRPGDRMRATIAATSAGWRMTLRDVTTGRGFSTVVAGGSGGVLAGHSAEWIEEPPMTPWGATTLADFRAVTFDDGLLNGSNPRLTSSEAGRIVRRGVVVAMPSVPDSTRDGFTIRYGSSVPPAPRG